MVGPGWHLWLTCLAQSKMLHLGTHKNKAESSVTIDFFFVTHGFMGVYLEVKLKIILICYLSEWRIQTYTIQCSFHLLVCLLLYTESWANNPVPDLKEGNFLPYFPPSARQYGWVRSCRAVSHPAVLRNHSHTHAAILSLPWAWIHGDIRSCLWEFCPFRFFTSDFRCLICLASNLAEILHFNLPLLTHAQACANR